MLNAATAGSQSDASILYYGLDQQLSLNDKALNEETPLAAFQSKSINQRMKLLQRSMRMMADKPLISDMGLLGTCRAAGSSYLSWQEIGH